MFAGVHSAAAYLEASDERTRDLYLRHGYTDHGEAIELPDGPSMYPMVRIPGCDLSGDQQCHDRPLREENKTMPQPRPHQPQPNLAGWPLHAALLLGALPTAPSCGRAWTR